MFRNSFFVWPLLGSLLFQQATAQTKQTFSLSGTVRDKNSGETLAGATVSFPERPGMGVVTNAYGYYSITLPNGNYSVVVSFSGYLPDTNRIDLHRNIVLNGMLSAGGSALQQVVVAARKGVNILKTPPGVQRLSMTDIKEVPVLLGEKDVLKTIQLLPGIKSAGDGRSGFFVRGGGADQNLIMLDEAPVYDRPTRRRRTLDQPAQHAQRRRRVPLPPVHRVRQHRRGRR